jgi:hypothetical protein
MRGDVSSDNVDVSPIRCSGGVGLHNLDTCSPSPSNVQAPFLGVDMVIQFLWNILFPVIGLFDPVNMGIF